MNAKSFARHVRKIEHYDKFLDARKMSVKAKELTQQDKIEKKFGQMMEEEDPELSVVALSLLKKKESSTYTAKDLMANILRSQIKDKIFNE